MARELRIRPSNDGDEPFLRELGQLAFSEYARDAGQHTASMARQARTLIAELDATAVGLAVVEFPEPKLAHLAAIAVTLEERGTGVGEALLRAAIALGRGSGAGRLRVMTADSNVAALSLFFRSGFRRSTSGIRRYSRGQRAVLLEMPL